jgi:hypothetical protein
MNNANILFYSNQCASCRNLMLLMRNAGFLEAFKLICVDGILDRLPSQITIVPTMIVVGINKPLVAQEAFKWVEQMKFLKYQQLEQAQNKNKNNIIPPKQEQKAPKLDGFIQTEMAGISDQFAYIENDDPLPHSYFGLGEENKHIIFTAPVEQTKLSAEEQSRNIKSLEAKRQHQDSEYAKYMEQQQLMAVQNKK